MIAVSAAVLMPDQAYSQATAPTATAGDVAIATGLLSAGIMSAGVGLWWIGAGYSGWHLVDHGIAGPEGYAGGADKAGHVYGWYAAQRGLTQIYAWVGMTRIGSLIMGSALALIVSTLVEVADGFTRYGFEGWDVAANVVGVAFGALVSVVPNLETLLGLRMSYIPTADLLDGRVAVPTPITDYSGMMFFFDVKPAGLTHMLGLPVGPARYLTFGASYNTVGYKPFAPPGERNVGVFVGLNASEILEALWGPESTAVKVGSTFLRFYALPFLNAGTTWDLDGGADKLHVGISNRWRRPL